MIANADAAAIQRARSLSAPDEEPLIYRLIKLRCSLHPRSYAAGAGASSLATAQAGVALPTYLDSGPISSSRRVRGVDFVRRTRVLTITGAGGVAVAAESHVRARPPALV